MGRDLVHTHLVGVENTGSPVLFCLSVCRTTGFPSFSPFLSLALRFLLVSCLLSSVRVPGILGRSYANILDDYRYKLASAGRIVLG